MPPAHDAQTPTDRSITAMVEARVREVRTGLERLVAWRRDLVAELAAMPDTLRRIREGAANFELVSQRLAGSSESLEEITALYESTLADATRRSADAADALKQQLESLVGQSPERVASTVGDMQRTVEALARLNPLWPGGRRPPPTS